MGRLAHGFATGGLVGALAAGSFTPAFATMATGGFVDPRTLYQQFFDAKNPRSTEVDPTSVTGFQSDYFGDIKAGTTKAQREVGQISAPRLPSDEKERIRVILRYVQEVQTTALGDGYVFWAVTSMPEFRRGSLGSSKNTTSTLPAGPFSRAMTSRLLRFRKIRKSASRRSSNTPATSSRQRRQMGRNSGT
jgi:hypothetical protein